MTSRFPSLLPRALRASIALAFAWLHAAGAAAATAPAEAATPAASAASAAKPAVPESFGPIRPVVGVLVTGEIENNPAIVVNPDGSDATGILGKRLQVFAGAEFGVAANGLKLRLTVGEQEGRIGSPEGGERFTRFPLEATLLYPINDKLRLGGGVRYAARPRFGGPGGNTADGINSAPGALAVVDYRVAEHLLLDARYVYEHYESALGDQEGSHVGIGATLQY